MAEQTTDITAGPGGVMTDEVGVVTGDLTLRSEISGSDVTLRVQYKDADEWYTVTGGRASGGPHAPAGTAPVGGSPGLAEIPDLRCRARAASPPRPHPPASRRRAGVLSGQLSSWAQQRAQPAVAVTPNLPCERLLQSHPLLKVTDPRARARQRGNRNQRSRVRPREQRSGPRRTSR
jgi:hypothetical protein